MIVNGIDYPIETPTYVLNENFRNFAPEGLTTVAVSGDEYTSAIILKTPRYYKNLDLSEYTARAYYYTHWLDDEQKSSEGSVPLYNYEVQENNIIYVWQLDINQTYKKGRVDFGLSWSNDDWKLNTKGCYFVVQRFVNIEGSYIAPDIAEQLQAEIDTLFEIKQNKEDNTLLTEDKTVVGAINEVNTVLNTHTSNLNNPHEVTKVQVGLGNVNNTSDLNKPISIATQAALDNKQDKFANVEDQAGDDYLTPKNSAVYFQGRYRFIPDSGADENEYDIVNRTMLEGYHDNTKQDNIATVDQNSIVFDDKKVVFPQIPTSDSSPNASSDLTTKSYVDNADIDLQQQIDVIASSSDVVDVVGTYAELQAYDTSHLKDNDIVKVLEDSTHNDAITYYRWEIDQQTHVGAWDYIGSSGPYYTKSETDTLLDTKQDKTDNNLDTTSKNIVGAINEVNQKAKDNQSQITALGNLKQNKVDPSLDTTDKTIVGAINELQTHKQEVIAHGVTESSVMFDNKDFVFPQVPATLGTPAYSYDLTTKSYVDNADNNLQQQIDAIASSSDVVDVVGTYAELQAYDTSKLKNNDIVKVLEDSTHNNAITYYRWEIDQQTHTGSWEYIGQSGPYYTKSETDTLLQGKADENSFIEHTRDHTNPHLVTKSQVGLGNVDNTSDANKPISTATQTALNGKVDKATSEWLNTHDEFDNLNKIFQCTTTGYGFTQGYFYILKMNSQTLQAYWENIPVQDLSNYYNKTETDDLLNTKQPLTDIENGEGDYSLQQKTDAENQPLALGKWSMAEGRGQNFVGTIIDILALDDTLYTLHVINEEEVTDNIFYYRPTTSGLAPNKIYSMSLVWENTGRAFSYGTNGTFCIYAYNGSSWVPITSTNYTTSFKINSMPLQYNATYYNITFKTESVPELREIVFAFGALSSKSVGFNTGKWTLYRLDDDVWTDISDRCPDFNTVQFRGASDAAMDNWFANWAGTDRGMIWRRNTRDDLSFKEQYENAKWYQFTNSVLIGGINADKIRENAVLWFPINEGGLTNTQGAYFYVKNASKTYPALLELDAYERQIKDGDGNNIRLQSIYDSAINSQILVYMGAAISSDSHTEGNFNNAVWLNSDTRINEVDVRRQHVEGSRNLATGYAVTISGEYNRATGNHTDVGGEHNEAHYAYQTVRGYYNDNKEGNLFEIGNGNENTKQNAFEVHSDGTAKVQVQGSTNDSVAQKGYVDTQVVTKQNIIQKSGYELDIKEDVIIDGTYQCIAGYSGEEVHCTVEDIYGTPQNGFVYGYFYHYVGDNKYILIDVQPRTDLTNYVTNTDYATGSVGGVVKISSSYSLGMSNGNIVGVLRTYDYYKSMNDLNIISKGTLNNVLSGMFVTLTQTQYDNLQTIDPNTYYYIIEE